MTTFSYKYTKIPVISEKQACYHEYLHHGHERRYILKLTSAKRLEQGKIIDQKKEDIMKTSTRFALILALGLCVSVNLLAQKPSDMVGTWVGDATLEGMSEPNEFTLVLELKDEKLSGHMTDQYETMSEAPISDIKLEDGVFSFSVLAIGPGGQELKLILKMNVDGDSMNGTLEVPDMGMNGTWEATKQ